MAVIEFQTRLFNSGAALSNVEVTGKWNVLGIPLEHKIFTDSEGKGKLDVGATSANVLFTGKRGTLRFVETYEVNVGLFGIGVTPPNPQIFYMKDDFTAPVVEPIKGIIDTITGAGKTTTTIFAVALGITLAVLAVRYIQTGTVPGVVSKGASAVKSTAKGALGSVKK